MVFSSVDMIQLQIKVHWMLLWIFILCGIYASVSKCNISSTSDEEIRPVNIEFEKSYSMLTGKPIENSIILLTFKWHNEYLQLLGNIMVIQGAWMFFIVVIYWYTQHKVSDIVPETKLIFDKILNLWKSMGSAVFETFDDTVMYNKLCYLALVIHRKHIKILKRYFHAEIVLICTLMVYICTSVYLHVFINKMIYDSRTLWAYHESKTASSFPEIKCFLNHFNTIQDMFTLVYFGYLFASALIMINLYTPIKDYILHRRETHLNRNLQPITITQPFLEEKRDLTPNYIEFLLIKLITNSNYPKLICHIEKNIFNDRYNVFDRYDLY